MKKILLLSTIILVSISLSGCSWFNKNKNQEKNPEPKTYEEMVNDDIPQEVIDKKNNNEEPQTNSEEQKPNTVSSLTTTKPSTTVNSQTNSEEVKPQTVEPTIPQAAPEPMPEVKEPQEPQTKVYSLEEVVTHNNSTDCWLLINGNVYNVTNFISRHPGGTAIIQGCGTDATELFETRPMGSGTPHSTNAQSMLSDFFIGNLE